MLRRVYVLNQINYKVDYIDKTSSSLSYHDFDIFK